MTGSDFSQRIALRGTASFDAVALAALAVTILGWAASFAAIRAGLTAFGTLELGALRFAIAAVPAAGLLIAMQAPLPNTGEFARLIVGGLLFVTLYTVLLNAGELTVSSGPASFIINVAPIMTAILAGLFLGERFRRRAWAGTALSFFGIGLLAAGEGDNLRIGGGALLILGAAACASVGTILQKPLFARHSPLTVSAWMMLFGALFLLPGLPSALSQFSTAGMDARLAALFLALVSSFASYAAWAVALSRLPAGRASNFLYLIPPVATLFGFVWLGEVPTAMSAIGGVVALCGVIIVNLRRR